MKYKTLSAAISLLSIGVISASAVAQTQNIPVPASAVNGGRAVVAITIPAIPALPSNICTSTNGHCVTAATLPSQVAPLIPDQTRAKGTFATDYQYVVSSPYGTEVQFRIGFVCVWGMGDPTFRADSIFGPTIPNGYARCPAGSGAMNITTTGLLLDAGGGS